jgi:hypothetical protein
MNISKTLTRFSNQLRAFWKFCLSFHKHDWDLDDYPVVFRTQKPDPGSIFHSSRFTLHHYLASIVNWHLTGGGDSREEALQKLSDTFAAAKAKKRETGEPLPRPGTRVPIEFASQDRVNSHPALSDDFIHSVLEIESAWISDESSLWDFHTDETNDALCARIKEIYGVDVSDIKSGRLCEIFDRIAVAHKSKSI